MICTKENDYTKERFLNETRWEAQLSNGLICISDNDNKDYLERSAWLRLKQFLIENPSIYIDNLKIRFRDNLINPVPDKASAYMIRDGAFSTLHQQETKKLIIIGHLDLIENKMLVQTWFVPDLRRLKSEWRELTDEKSVGNSLILNYGKR